ncbi:MAG: lysylphosphatidylglycerol synthase transmembrane domain-containing protein [Candidatus Micrarchaeota archaeon]
MVDKTKVILVSISILLLALLLAYGNPAQLLAYLSHAKPEFVLLSLVFMSFSMLARVFRWQILLKEVQPITFRELLPIQFFGLALSNLAPGKLSEPAKSIILKSTHSTTLSSSLPTVALERLGDMLAVLFYSTLVFLFLPASYLLLPIALFALATFIFILASNNSTLEQFVLNLVKRFAPNFRENAQTMFLGLKLKRSFLPVFIISLAIWAIDSLAIYAILTSVGVSLADYGIHGFASQFALILGFLAFSVLIGLISFLPGGIGSTELSVAFLFTLIGVPRELAISWAIISRIPTFWYALVLGLLSSVFIKKQEKR